VSQLPDIDDGSYVCSKCDLPVAKINGVWQHAEHADAVVCGLLSGNPLAWAGWPTDEDLAEEEEPEPGGATSAWEHHHGL
jgi:CHASE2 domain-containing sensor protein